MTHKKKYGTIEERRKNLQREIREFETWAAQHNFERAITEPQDLIEFFYGNCLDRLVGVVTDITNGG